MAPTALTASRRQDWILANPWPFALVGLAGSLLALATTRFLGPDWHFLRGTWFLLGLVAGGISLVLRLNSSRPAFVENVHPAWRGPLLRGLAVLFLVAAAGLSALLVLSVVGASFVRFRWGSLLVVWLAVVPISLLAARNCLSGARAESTIPWGHEAACLLILMALNCMAACWSLDFGKPFQQEWKTMRLFLSVASFAALIAAPFFLVGQLARRLGLTFLFVLHFGGICTAAIAAPPFPWIMGQLWTRIYRPYLEFMYLNNAYHFYAPEPGPSSLMWFRLIFADARGVEHGIWLKIPDLDDDGWHRNTVALEYQRYLSITENVAQGTNTTAPLYDSSANPLFAKDDDGIITYNMTPAMKRRWRKSEFAIYFAKMREQLAKASKEGDGEIVGKVPVMGDKDKKVDVEVAKKFNFKVEPILVNPMDYPDIVPLASPGSFNSQYAPPRESAQKLIESYVRHVAGRVHDVPPDWTLQRIKVYKVRHVIFPWDDLVHGRNPLDPIYYQPFFMGDYNASGKLLDKNDPMLFWLLPVLRQNYSDPASLTANFALRHAGDRNWVSTLNRDGKRRWFEPTRGHFEPPGAAPKVER